jgi:hypothetical protein
MSEQIQNAFDEWMSRDYTNAEHAFSGVNKGWDLKAPAFHGGYTACQARIREKIAELESWVNPMSESTYEDDVREQVIRALREVLGEI